MTSIDERIAAALRHDAPPPRDAAFRVQVLERRERQLFRRRSRQAMAAGTAVAVTTALTVSSGGEAYAAGSALLGGLVLVMTGVVYLPTFGRLIASLRVTTTADRSR